jgi:hypothetical protein
MKSGRRYRKQALYPLGVEESTTNIAMMRTTHIDRIPESPMANLSILVVVIHPQAVLYLPIGQRKDTKGWSF